MKQSDPATPSSRRRFWSWSGSPLFLYRVVVVGIMLSTTIGIFYATTNRPSFVAGFPGATNLAVYLGFLVVAGGGLIALAGLLRYRRWALYLYTLLTLISVMLDVIAEAPLLHQGAVVVGASVVLVLAYINREHFVDPTLGTV